MKTASDFFRFTGSLCAPYLSLPLSDEISMPWANMGCNGFFWENAEYLVCGKGLAQDIAPPTINISAIFGLSQPFYRYI
jgi:hypothetical protein